LEAAPRGIYTGSIGRIDAGGRGAAFNVAIRALTLGDSMARAGLGSGIVADSRAAPEWDECLAKGAFIASRRVFDLVETMAFDPMNGFVRLDAHLARMKASAALFGFSFDRHAARNELQAATIRLRHAARVRLLLAQSGKLAIEVAPMPPVPDEPVDVAVVPLPVEPADFRLRHKTTDRAFYDRSRRAVGAFEVVYARTDGQLTEGSFTNVFLERDGALLTPPLDAGLLGGILRQELLETGRARETPLRSEDLTDGFFLGNSLRGLLPARLRRL
jgi:para-aminobenzoate synthetase / 4-amino-4-deoxychorismate lyase